MPRWVLRYTAHARRRMRERGIGEEDVEEALRSPVQLVYDEHRDTYLALGWNNVAVVYAPRGCIVEIVTVLRRREYEALLRRLGSRRYKIIE